MDKITVNLHIGSGKTGSSAIQNFMDLNRSLLFHKCSCLYPNFDDALFYKGRNHNHSKWYVDIADNDNVFTTEMHELIGFTQKHGIQKIVLSNEGWLFRKELPARMQNIAATFNDVEVKAICYLRRVDQLFESAWKQWGLKQYETPEEYRLTFANFLERTLSSLKLWESLFGKESLIIRPYEKQQLPKGLLYDFLSCLGIDYDSYSWYKNEETNLALNHGFNMDVLEVMHLSREFIPDLHDNHMTDLFAELLGNKFQKQPFESLSILSPAQRLELINTNAPYEQEIARRYMNREDGRIFYDPLPSLDEPWQPYEGLTLEKFIPIVIQMIDRQDQMIKGAYQLASEITLYSLIRKMKIVQPLRRLWRWIRGKDRSNKI